MTGSGYAPQRWEDVEASKVTPVIVGATDTVTAGTTKNIDVLIADDSLLRRIEFLASGSAMGDTISISVIDKDAIYAPANTILAAPVTNFNIPSDQQLKTGYDAIAPQKILGGVYMRFAYTSTAIIGNVSVEINLFKLKVLV